VPGKGSKTTPRWLACCLLLFVGWVAPSVVCAQGGAMTIPRNLEQLTDRAADIVRGTVVSAHVEKHPQLQNLDTVVVQLKVHESIKGAAQGSYTFRQFIWDIRDRKDSAGYSKGQEYVLLMNAPSRYGLTSPAGMEQGRFRILRDASGRQTAVNGRGNAMLMKDLPVELARSGVALSPASSSLVAKHRLGPIPVDDLVRLIRELMR
jgi:hypothetical protein